MSTFGFTGDLLIRKGIIDARGLGLAIEARSLRPMTLGRALAGLLPASEEAVAAAIASALRLEYLDGEPPLIDEDILALLPEEVRKKYGVVPLSFDGKVLRVALADPENDSVLQDVRFRTGKTPLAVVVTETWLDRVSAQARRTAPPAKQYDMLGRVDPAGEVESTNELEYELVDAATLAKDVLLPPIVRLVNLILSDAATAGASDVHIEPQETSVQIRQRVDGVLRDILTIPLHLRDQTISRMKIMSGMDIAERRKPQDGRSRLRFAGRRIDLRVSTLPTQYGEKIVIRLLNSERAVQPLDQVGFSPQNVKLIKSFLAHPQGMILVTGPTGSGKTSTLYTALNTIKSSGNNIITLEDPIELRLPGVNQMQINSKAGVTFATGLRSILRQDPNVILVGEIRDQETAEIALQAAQTGHLLLSTLHTNDAPATLTRLFDLGIQPFLVASSLVGILAQRLVRQPCPACAVPQEPSAETLERVGGRSRLPVDGRWVMGLGCDQCSQTGLKGRIAIHEVLEITDEIRELITNRASEQAIRKAAKRAGMKTLFEDGLDKAAQGLTTLDELLRVVSASEQGEASPAAASAAIDRPVPVAEPASEAGAPRRKVLVVDDSATIASVVKYFLELEGFEVLLATDGLMGLETARREHPIVIVSDMNMPGMGGVEMIRTLRSDARFLDVRILMLTSEASVESEAEGLAAGADDYILKPVEPRRLAARVKALLARPSNRAA